MERFFRERSRLLQFCVRLVCSTNAYRNKCVSLEYVKYSAKPIADPISFVSQALDLFWRGALLLLIDAIRLGFFVLVRIKFLFPKIFRTAHAALLRVCLYECQAH